jgi:hypothetical protein
MILGINAMKISCLRFWLPAYEKNTPEAMTGFYTKIFNIGKVKNVKQPFFGEGEGPDHSILYYLCTKWQKRWIKSGASSYFS